MCIIIIKLGYWHIDHYKFHKTCLRKILLKFHPSPNTITLGISWESGCSRFLLVAVIDNTKTKLAIYRGKDPLHGLHSITKGNKGKKFAKTWNKTHSLESTCLTFLCFQNHLPGEQHHPLRAGTLLQ